MLKSNLEKIFKRLNSYGDIIVDVLEKYKDTPVTYHQYTGGDTEKIRGCEELSEYGILSSYSELNYMEIMEPWISCFEKVKGTNSMFLDSDVQTYYKELQNNDQEHTLSTSLEKKNEIEIKTARLINRVFRTAEQGTEALNKERIETLYVNFSFEERASRLHSTLEKTENVIKKIELLRDFINHRTMVRMTQNDFLIHAKQNFRHKLPVLVEKLQKSLKETNDSVRFYELQEQELNNFRKLMIELTERPENTNIELVSAENFCMDVDDSKQGKALLYFPPEKLDPENFRIVSAVVQCEQESLDELKRQKSKISLAKPKAPERKHNFKLPSQEKIIQDFMRSENDSLFDFVFSHRKLEDKTLLDKFNFYLELTKIRNGKLIPTENVNTVVLDGRKFLLRDFNKNKKNSAYG